MSIEKMALIWVAQSVVIGYFFSIYILGHYWVGDFLIDTLMGFLGAYIWFRLDRKSSRG